MHMHNVYVYTCTYVYVHTFAVDQYVLLGAFAADVVSGLGDAAVVWPALRRLDLRLDTRQHHLLAALLISTLQHIVHTVVFF